MNSDGIGWWSEVASEVEPIADARCQLPKVVEDTSVKTTMS
jgi:hypothetical protein